MGTFTLASDEIINNDDVIRGINLETTEAVTECVTQSTTDCDGDIITVTCCRETWEEAFNCAAAKLRAAAMAACL